MSGISSTQSVALFTSNLNLVTMKLGEAKKPAPNHIGIQNLKLNVFDFRFSAVSHSLVQRELNQGFLPNTPLLPNTPQSTR